jgi:hypothetical protein
VTGVIFVIVAVFGFAGFGFRRLIGSSSAELTQRQSVVDATTWAVREFKSRGIGYGRVVCDPIQTIDGNWWAICNSLPSIASCDWGPWDEKPLARQPCFGRQVGFWGARPPEPA